MTAICMKHKFKNGTPPPPPPLLRKQQQHNTGSYCYMISELLLTPLLKVTLLLMPLQKLYKLMS